MACELNISRPAFLLTRGVNGLTISPSTGVYDSLTSFTNTSTLLETRRDQSSKYRKGTFTRRILNPAQRLGRFTTATYLACSCSFTSPIQIVQPEMVMGAFASAPKTCTFQLGFKDMQQQLGTRLVGGCLENAHYDVLGNAEQRTQGGLLVWSKKGNFMTFTDGYHTWVRGYDGKIYTRLNTQRFSWESASKNVQEPSSNKEIIPTETSTPGKRDKSNNSSHPKDDTTSFDNPKLKPIRETIDSLRFNQGLQPLVYDSRLCQFADYRLNQLDGKQINHDGFFPQTNMMFQKGFDSLGENLASGPFTGNGVAIAWMRSTPHLQNLIHRNFNAGCLAERNNTYVLELGHTVK